MAPILKTEADEFLKSQNEVKPIDRDAKKISTSFFKAFEETLQKTKFIASRPNKKASNV